MRILIVANGYPPTAMGGVEIYTAELSRYLVSQGHQVTVFCRESDFSRPDYTINTEYLDQVKIVRVVNDYKDPHSFRKTIVDPHLEQIFDEFLESEQPDLIHFNHLIALSAQLPLIAATRNIPTMITLHDFWPICHRINLIDWRGQICPGPLQGVNCAACVVRGNLRQKAAQAVGTTLYKLKGYLSNRKQSPDGTSLLETADPPPALASFPKIYADRLDLFTRAVLACRRILVPSEYVRSQYSVNGIPFDRIDVIPLGIEPVPAAQALRPTSGNLTFATIGPLQPIKGMDLVIKAFRLVSGDHLRLKIFGRTDLFPRDHA
ncbi:MAG TPA: glycosyltransferase, partial [Anaerolineales bacterium]|nr:glycosyltransferase [Anaerolineales bacterium]